MNTRINSTAKFTRPLINTSFALVASFTPILAADWPTNPETPLIVGHAEGSFGPRISIATTDDQANWISWQDSFCQGSLRIQRASLFGDLLAPIGVEIQDDPTCGFTLPPILSTHNNAAIVTRAQSGLDEFPLHNINDSGSSDWISSFSPQDPTGLRIANSIKLASDDTLVVSSHTRTVRADRLDAQGNQVWESPCEFENNTSSNFRIFSVVPETSGGAYIFYDSHLSYTKNIYCMRITPQGQPAWESPIRTTDFFEGVTSSRHTDPVAVSDSAGGAILIWTKGFETATTPAPLLMQQINSDGSLTFPLQGVRVSLDPNRQFNPKIQTEPVSGDLIITWRDGQSQNMTLNAQRISTTGTRIWGDTGLSIQLIDPINEHFDTLWHNDQLAVAVADKSGVHIHTIDPSGTQSATPWILSTAGPATDIRIAKSETGIVGVWQVEGPENNDLVVAQRINPDGSLGKPICDPDINQDNQLNFFDVSAFLSAFAGSDPIADFNNDLEFNFFDISEFLSAFTAGCP